MAQASQIESKSKFSMEKCVISKTLNAFFSKLHFSNQTVT